MSSDISRSTPVNVNTFSPPPSTVVRSRTITEAVRDNMLAPTVARGVGTVSRIHREEAVSQHDYMVRVATERQGDPGVQELVGRLQDISVLYDTGMIEVYRRLVTDVKTDKA